MNCSEEGLKECDNSGITKFCFEIEGGGFECDCPSWWGFTGETCDGSSIQLVYYKTVSIVFLFLTLFSFSLDIYNAVTLTKFYNNACPENRARVKRARLRSLLGLGLLKHVVFLGFIVINLIGAFASGEELVREVSRSLVAPDFEYVFPVNARLFYFLLYGSFSALVLQTVEIYVSWVNLLYSLPNFLIHFRYHKLAVFVGKSSPYVVWLYSFTWIIFISLGYLSDAVLISGVIAVFYVIVGLLARRDMRLTFEAKDDELSDDLKGVVFLVLRSSTLFLTCWLLLWISVVINNGFGDISRSSPPGSLNIGMVGQDASVGFAFFLSCTVSWYIAKILSNFNPEVTVTHMHQPRYS